VVAARFLSIDSAKLINESGVEVWSLEESRDKSGVWSRESGEVLESRSLESRSPRISRESGVARPETVWSLGVRKFTSSNHMSVFPLATLDSDPDSTAREKMIDDTRCSKWCLWLSRINSKVVDVELAVCEVHAEWARFQRSRSEIKSRARFSGDRLRDRETQSHVIAFYHHLLKRW